MRAKIAILVWLIASFNLDAISVNVQAGVERFACYRDLLAGRKVAIVANQTSCVGDSHAVDFLRGKGVNLVKVFCPEHGFRGNARVARQLLDAGFYLSYGQYFNPEAVRITPIDRLLVETDESPLPIEEICALVALNRGDDVAALAAAVASNATSLINISLV